MKTKFINLLFRLISFIGVILLGIWIGKQLGIYFSPKKTETQFQVIQSFQPIAKIATYKIHHIEDLEWSNETNSPIANFFYSKKLNISVPVIATYGYDLKNTLMDIQLQKDTIIIRLGQPKLLHFEILWNEKKVFSEKGLLQWENNHQFDAVEKLFYNQKLKKYENHSDALNYTKKIFKEQVSKFYGKLGYQVQIFEQ